jgi:imidazolonepropionase-like amidohydrolase
VRRLRYAGHDFIKVHSALSRRAYAGAADEARRLRIPLVGHVPHAVSALEASMAGQRSIEHLSGLALCCSAREQALRKALLAELRGKPDALSASSGWRFELRAYDSYDRRKARALFAHLADKHTWQVPTLVEARVYGLLDKAAVTGDARARYLPPLVRRLWRVEKKAGRVALTGLGVRFSARDLADRRRLFRYDKKLVGALHRAGVRLLAGTDTPNPYVLPGFSLHDELELLVEAGLTPLVALQTATLNPALFLNRDKELGAVQVGKRADLVLLDADPLRRISNTRKIAAVIVGGKLLDRRALDALLVSLERPTRK